MAFVEHSDVSRNQEAANSTHATTSPSTDTEKVTRLRSLLLGSDYEHAIKTFLTESDTDRVAKVISEALNERAQKDGSLGKVLAPIIDKAIDTSIKDNPKRITNVIFPVMGPAIRKAVAAALSDMVQTLNQILSNSLSVKSWGWRFQAWRAGKSYGEYVLLKTIKYKVDQVFLIHKETGLLLCDVCDNSVIKEDPELVSSMLTAINDFVTDSFHKPEKLSIDSIRFGEYTLTIVAGPLAVLAAAVKGSPNQNVSNTLSSAIEKIHIEHLQSLIDFDGDKDSLLATEPILKECLIKQSLVPEKRQPWLAYSLLTALAMAGLFQSYLAYQTATQKQAVVDALQIIPEYLIVDQKSTDNQLNIVLLRPPGSPDPNAVIQQVDKGDWQVTIDDKIAPLQTGQYLLPFIKSTFSLNNNTQLTVGNDNQLVISGSITEAQQNRLLNSNLLASAFTGVDTQSAQIIPGPTQQQLFQQQLQQTAAQLQALRIYFSSNSEQIIPGEEAKLSQAISHINRLQDLSNQLGTDQLQIIITGYADFRGSDRINTRLSQNRAETISDMLKANGINSQLIVAWGGGSINTQNLSAQEQRIVSFQVLHPFLNEASNKE